MPSCNYLLKCNYAKNNFTIVCNIIKIIITEKIDIVSMVFDLLFIQLFYVNILLSGNRYQSWCMDTYKNVDAYKHINNRLCHQGMQQQEQSSQCWWDCSRVKLLVIAPTTEQCWHQSWSLASDHGGGETGPWRQERWYCNQKNCG